MDVHLQDREKVIKLTSEKVTLENEVRELKATLDNLEFITFWNSLLTRIKKNANDDEAK